MPTTQAKLKPTTNPRQAWLLLLLVVGCSLMFATLVLPKLGAPKQSVLVRSPAPDFNLEVIAGGDPGNRIRLADQKGKVVVLDFWASWCIPCRKQAPIVSSIAQRHPRDVMLIGIDTNDRKSDGATWFRSQNLAYPSVFDENSQISTLYGVKGLPTLVVIGKKGLISSVQTGVVSAETLEELVATALLE